MNKNVERTMILAIAAGVAGAGLFVGKTALKTAGEIVSNEHLVDAVTCIPGALRRGATATAKELSEHAGGYMSTVFQNQRRKLGA